MLASDWPTNLFSTAQVQLDHLGLASKEHLANLTGNQSLTSALEKQDNYLKSQID